VSLFDYAIRNTCSGPAMILTWGPDQEEARTVAVRVWCAAMAKMFSGVRQ
jgi:hypothetical protein